MAIDKTKKFTDLAYEYIRKKLVKPSKGGITSLPTEKEVTNEMLQMFEKLRGAGYNVTNIGKEVKNADDLGFLINRIEQAELDQSKQFLDSAEALETIQFKLNNNIPLNPDDQKKLLGKNFKTASEAFQGFKPKVIQGGKKEGIEQLLKSGDVKKGVAPKTKPKDFNQEIRDLVAADEAAMERAEDFKSFENRIKGMSSKDRVAERLRDLKGVDLSNLSGIEAQKIASEVIGRKGPFKTISDKGAKEVLGELEPIIKRANADDLGTKLKNLPDDIDPDAMAQGGRIGMNRGGGILKFLSENNPIQAYKKYLQSVKRRAQEDPGKLFPELAALTSGGILVNRKMQRILEEGNELQKERFLKEFKEDIEKDPFYEKYPELKDKAIANYTESLFGEKKAMGGRIGFKEGSGMSRRTFLKLLGGLASIPLVGKFLKPAAKASKAVEVAAKSSGVPAYFPKLVEKIQLLGDDVSRTRATGERQIVKEYKGYELTEEMDTGKLTIKRDNYTSEEYLQFEPGGQYYDETRKKVIKYPDEYEEVTVKPDYEGKMKDVDYGLDSYDEILREVGETKVKKSGGGLAYMMGE